MITITATEAKNRLGKYLDAVHSGPVRIQRHSHKGAVLLSEEDYEWLQRLDDHYWIQRAEEAAKGGSLGVKESEKYLRRMLRKIRQSDRSDDSSNETDCNN